MCRGELALQTEQPTFKSPSLRSLRQQVAEEIRTAILEGRLKPGGRLLEADLASAFSVSRGCVREALRGLEMEGLVVSTPYKETRVASTSEDEIVEVLLPVRVAIETFVARNLAARLEPQQVAALEQIIDAMRSAAAVADRRLLTELDIRFHRQLLEYAGNPTINAIWAGIDTHIRGRFLLDTLAVDPHETVRIHEVYLEALRGGRPEAVGEAVVRHIYGRLPQRLQPSGAPLAARALVEVLEPRLPAPPGVAVAPANQEQPTNAGGG